MAGAGYKLFNTGDVLTAQQVNEYLMQQTVMVFASATARTTALSGVLAEGMLSYLKDTNATEVYDGSAWVSVSGTGDITGVTAGTGISGGGTAGTVTVTNDMATTITAAGDIVVGTGNATYDNLPIGTTGQVLTADTTVSPYKVKWATPASSGYTFTQRKLADGNEIYAIAYNGSNLFVAVGANGVLFTSPDGLTWTSRTSGFGANYVINVAYGNGLWVAVGGNGTITTSTDGITWTARTSNMGTNEIRGITYANSLWVAVGAGGGTTNTGGIAYSTDGITWTRKSQSLTVGSNYWDVVWNGTNWIVGADHSTNNHLYASTPSGTWTVGATGSGSGVFKVAWDGTRHITVENNTNFISRYSTSTTLGTTTAYSSAHRGTVQYPGGYALYNGKFYTQSGGYLGIISPSSSQYTTVEPPYLVSGYVNSLGTPTSTPQSIWVGSLGIIISGTTGGAGSIYTSF